MSEFHLVQIEVYDKECLINALKEMGYEPKVHENAQNLYGYRGDKRVQKAHIIIPRSQVGSVSNDVGFEFINGKYVLHLSEYDIASNKFNVNLLKKFYAKHKCLKSIRSKPTKYRVKSVKNKKNGQIKIRLSSLR